MSFFKKLAGGAKNVFKKATGGIDTTLRKAINTGGTIGSYIEKATPILTAINPELGAMAGTLGAGLKQGSGALQQVRAINNQVRGGDITGAIQKAKDIAQSSNSPSMSYF
jgi:hypothetical protein